jgi:hypothetical protein
VSPLSFAVIGTGRLARAVCFATAQFGEPIRVSVIGRSADGLSELCHIASLRASLNCSPVRFAAAIDPLTEVDSLAAKLTAREVALVLCCASWQSPWEPQTAPSAWTDVMVAGGIGAMMPLYTQVSWLAARAIATMQDPATLVNACYPDAVNPVLAAAGAPVLAGVGNVAMVAAALQLALGLPDQQRLKVIGHHLHLSATSVSDGSGTEARGWLDDSPVGDVGHLLAGHRRSSRTESNAATGLAGALLVRALLNRQEMYTSLPGVLGLPGGYPVVVHGGTLQLNLPAGVTKDLAVAWNQEWAGIEGVRVDQASGRVEFAHRVSRILRPLIGNLAEGFPALDCDAVATAMLTARAELRMQPAGVGDRGRMSE